MKITTGVSEQLKLTEVHQVLVDDTTDRKSSHMFPFRAHCPETPDTVGNLISPGFGEQHLV